MRGVFSASVVAVVLALTSCTLNQPQAAPEATPSTPAVSTTPSTAPTPTDTPTPSTAPPAAPSPSPAKVIITSVNFHMGEVGVAYGTVTAGAAGGVKPYKWSISSGALPAGLALSKAGGSTTGKPTAPGTFSFVIRVDDSAGGAAGVPRSILVFRQLVFNVSGAMCGNGPKRIHDCSTAPNGPLHIPYSGGIPGAKPLVKITGITGGTYSTINPIAVGLCHPPVSTNSAPTGMTVSASGGFMTLSARLPGTYCTYRATITFVLVNPTPCGAGFLCTSSNTLSVVFNL